MAQRMASPCCRTLAAGLPSPVANPDCTLMASYFYSKKTVTAVFTDEPVWRSVAHPNGVSIRFGPGAAGMQQPACILCSCLLLFAINCSVLLFAFKLMLKTHTQPSDRILR